MVSVCGRPFDDGPETTFLYDIYGHKGVVAETKGYYANRPIITYFVIYMAINSITCGLNVWVSGDLRNANGQAH